MKHTRLINQIFSDGFLDSADIGSCESEEALLSVDRLDAEREFDAIMRTAPLTGEMLEVLKKVKSYFSSEGLSSVDVMRMQNKVDELVAKAEEE